MTFFNPDNQQEGVLLDIMPTYGPQAGGTMIYIKVPTTQDLRVSDIHIGKLPCQPLSQ